MIELDRRELFKKIALGGVVLLTPKQALAETQEADPLAEYLSSIAAEKSACEDVIVGHPGNFDPVDLDGFQRYFPVYRAGQISYQIPWLLTFIIHKEETTYSRDPNTYSRLYAGAMQRSVGWPIAEVDEAAKDWTFLRDLPNQQPNGRGNDWKEIIWATKHIRDLAGSADESAILGSLNKYSADGPAARRAARFRLLKPLFPTQDSP